MKLKDLNDGTIVYSAPYIVPGNDPVLEIYYYDKVANLLKPVVGAENELSTEFLLKADLNNLFLVMHDTYDPCMWVYTCNEKKICDYFKDYLNGILWKFDSVYNSITDEILNIWKHLM